MRIFRHYLTLILFSMGLLFGVQCPNFVDQYEKRIDAHLIEAKAQLAGFSEIADRLYNGDINELIARHARSEDSTFRAEQPILKENFNRLQRFELAKGALKATLLGKVVHILFSPERDVLEETVRNYAAAFPLTTDAILSGLIGALVLCLVFEFMLGGVLYVLRRLRGGVSRRDHNKLPRRI